MLRSVEQPVTLDHATEYPDSVMIIHDASIIGTVHERCSAWNRWQLHCLFSSVFRPRAKISNLRITSLCKWNQPLSGYSQHMRIFYVMTPSCTWMIFMMQQYLPMCHHNSNANQFDNLSPYLPISVIYILQSFLNACWLHHIIYGHEKPTDLVVIPPHQFG